MQKFDPNVVLASNSIQVWLANFSSTATRKAYRFHIVHFFGWLWIVKHECMTPDEVLADENKRHVDLDVQRRVKWSYEALEYGKDSVMPDGYSDGWMGNKGLGHSAKTQAHYAVKSWFAYNNLPLQAVKYRIEDEEREDLAPFDLVQLGKIVKCAPLKWRSALLVLLHSAVRIGDLFSQVGLLWPVIKEQINKKACIIKINVRGMEILHEIPWRETGTTLVCLPLYGATTRGKIFKFFTFLAGDALDELHRYVKERGEPAKGERIWDCDKTRLQKKIHVYAIKAGLMEREKGNKKGGLRYPIYVHRIRKIFKTTCQQRGVSEVDSEFAEGHKRTGVDKIYDERHISHPEVFAAEFLKVEPCLNLLSNPEGKTPKATESFIQRFDPKWLPVSLESLNQHTRPKRMRSAK